MNGFKFPKYSSEWATLSKKCKIRDNYRCTQCNKKEAPNNKLQAHHITSKSKNGRDDIANLRTLCEECHTLNHPHMKKKPITKKLKISYRNIF